MWRKSYSQVTAVVLLSSPDWDWIESEARALAILEAGPAKRGGAGPAHAHLGLGGLK
jgi:hypothetical protein